MHEQVAILDFGSQYTHLISRRIRDVNVWSKIYPQDVTAAVLKKAAPIGLILSGGPQSVYDQTALKYNPEIFDLNIPILGLCYGHQLIAQHFGGIVHPGAIREFGFATLKFKIQTNERPLTKITADSNIFRNLTNNLTVWMSHGDSVTKVPDGFDVLASTNDCPVAAMGDSERRVYGLQFHPEVTHTKDDNKILYNFVVRICQAKQDWKIDDLLGEITSDIKTQADKKNVFMLVSGGVDSSVAFALLEKALGKKNVIGLHIDSGLMRPDESKQVKTDLGQAGFDNLHVVNAEEEFLRRLINVADPETKRKIIGEAYLDVVEEWWKKSGAGISPAPERKHQAFSGCGHDVRTQHEWLLGQGTIYPDTIESGGTRQADRIKTHHNRIDRIQEMIKQGRVIEPLKNFYKDEVRQIGRLLKIPDHLLNRHPYPGPGLGVMTLCSQKDIHVPKLRNLPPNSQILPIKSTGVQGDNRTYAYPLAVWGIDNWNELERLSTSVTNKYREINRVVKVCWTKQKQRVGQFSHEDLFDPPQRRGVPQKKIDLPAAMFKHSPNLFITKDRLDLLRLIHHQVNQIIRADQLYDKIWEFPIILLPIGLTSHGQSVVLRPISSTEAMTVNFYRLPKKTLAKIIRAIAKFPGIDAVFYDITNKPPATIQWE